MTNNKPISFFFNLLNTKKSQLIFLCFICLCLFSYGQTEQGSITNVKYKQRNNEIWINYNLNSKLPKSVFHISLIVFNSNGDTITAKSLKGDIDYNVRPGPDKQILWNYGNDNIKSMDNIKIQLIATKQKGRKEKYLRLAGLSIIFPGWGNSRLKSNRLFLITGAVTTVSTLSAFYFNQRAVKRYDEYLLSNTLDERTDLKDKWKKNRQLSFSLFALSTLLTVADLSVFSINYKQTQNSNKKIHGQAYFTYLTPEQNLPGIALSFRF